MAAKYIAFEGIDGSGKTRQVELLVKALEEKGFKVLATRELGSNDPACLCLRDLYLNSAYNMDELSRQLLLAACSVQHSEKVIRANLSRYDYIISDRSIESNLVHSYASGIDRELTEKMFLLDKRRLHPDIVILLDINPETSWTRLQKRTKEKLKDGGEDRIEARGLDFQWTIRNEYHLRSKLNPKYRIINCDDLNIQNTHLRVFSEVLHDE